MIITVFEMRKCAKGFSFHGKKQGKTVATSKFFRSGDECLEFLYRLAETFGDYEVIIKSTKR